MKDLVDYSNEPLETACKLAIAGNAIGAGTQAEFGRIYSIIEDSIGYRIDQEHYRQFKESVLQSFLIVYIADNAGEIVFDRILIEQMLAIKRLTIVLAVREKPIINDATRDDARQAGLDKVATIISSGSAVPATVLSRCSPEMLDCCRAADLIIAKGPGNYVSLKHRPENLFFLFRVSCAVIARNSGYAIDSPVFIASRALKNAALKTSPQISFGVND
jgi:uncharacterized protein with ATP-grasp and redox domains